MKFLCQVWFETAEIMTLTEEEGRWLTQESVDNDNRLRDSGHIVVANALRAPETARTVRVRKGEATVTDGPFAEMKEHLGGFVLIEAKDIDEATSIAATFPVARYGMIEVRAAYDIRFPNE
ncbi:YciI family protein [Rhizobium mayense]|uniref:YciI family protein n=1 Tax=Rhizobium mayense TaxID=1312184 RepID=A0ABT7K136_9HYPH|nr:YciI family protein [Rhizobium mayense]MDL2402314.1 YciI family protein [Rhizobium mayense]